MRVDWAIPCRYVEVQQSGGATLVGAGADLIAVPQLPTPVQVTFAVRFVGDPDELDGHTTHPIVTRLFDTDGNLRGEQRIDMEATSSQVVRGFAAELIVPVGIVIDAQVEGTYSVEFEIDGHTPKRVPVHVVTAETLRRASA